MAQRMRILTEIEIQIVDIKEENLQDIPASCRGCVYWEFPKEFEKTSQERKETQANPALEEKKREWFVKTLNEFGTCGKIVYSNDNVVGYAQYAPAQRLPQIAEYKSKDIGKIENGVVFLSCLLISDEKFRGMGIGGRVLEDIMEDLRRRGFKAIETFARRGNTNNPSGPMNFYIKHGFHVKDQANPEFPLMRCFL